MTISVPVPPVVFIIDNDQAVLSALAFAFETEGFRACAFRTPAEADQSEDLAIAACVVIDHDLPVESGLAYLTRLRLERRPRPAVLVATDPSLPLRQQARDMGIAIVEKPLLNDALFEAVSALTGRPVTLSRF